LLNLKTSNLQQCALTLIFIAQVLTLGIYFDRSLGTIVIGNVKNSTSGLNGLQVHVIVQDWLGNVQSSGNIYDDTDNPSGYSGYGAYTSNIWLVPEFVDTLRTYDAGTSDYSYGYTFNLSILKHS
jgi:hypothetical protein